MGAATARRGDRAAERLQPAGLVAQGYQQVIQAGRLVRRDLAQLEVRAGDEGALRRGEHHAAQPVPLPGEVVEAGGVHKSTMTHHFRTLRQAGLTRTVVAGRTHTIELRRDELDIRFPGLIDALTGDATPPD
ncbi:ArsR/SmtB family transcription factor [Dactylosporangium matsuzakiense]|uniref:ArsR/SmtB family transcription factor n=1 Tax=Dactylosporangium matsuzakiense TaxID=53360 RepID=UPI0022F2D11D|nr:helix-turn-helix domain-containing protein [Dactylosporangium matsuzakiense]